MTATIIQWPKPMKIQAAHIAADGTATFCNDKAVDVAYSGSAYAVAQIMWEKGWTVYGSPTQPLGDFLVVAPGYHPREFAINPGDEGWVVVTAADLDEFTDEPTTPSSV
jgi:hypothetical protein